MSNILLMDREPAPDEPQVAFDLAPPPDIRGYVVTHSDEPIINRFGVTWSGHMEVTDIAPFYVSFRARQVAGRFLLESLTIEYGGPTDLDVLGQGITPGVLRKISVPRMLKSIRWYATVKGVSRDWTTTDPERLRSILQATADAYRPRPRKRTLSLGDDHLRSLAERRLELDEAGDPSPVKTLAAELNYGVDTIRKRQKKAIAAGWLAPSGRGARRQAPGPRLLEAVAAEAESREESIDD